MIPHSTQLAEGLTSQDQRVVVVCEAVDADGRVVADLPPPTSGTVAVDADAVHRRALSAEFAGATALAVLSEQGVRLRVKRGLRLRGASLASPLSLTAGTLHRTVIENGELTLKQMTGPMTWGGEPMTWDGSAMAWGSA